MEILIRRATTTCIPSAAYLEGLSSVNQIGNEAYGKSMKQ
jgi:hypothetical protein